MDKMSNLFIIFIAAVMLGSTLVFISSNFIFAQTQNQELLFNNLESITEDSAFDGISESDNFQEINMTVDYGWKPGYFVVKKGIPVKWNIFVKNYGGCIDGLSVPSLNIYWRFTKTGEKRTIEFIPTQTGTIYFSCLMDMATGKIEVKEDVTLEEVNKQNSQSTIQPSSYIRGCGCSGGCYRR